MSEQVQDQISAFMDDELSAEECALLASRLERDPKTCDRILRYSAIGAALRGELLNPDPDALRRGVRAELGGGRQMVGPLRRSPSTRSQYIRPAIGLGLAASVVVAALALLNSVNSPVDALDPVPLVADGASSIGLEDEPGYAVSSETAGFLAVGDTLSPPIRLTNYLITHGQYAPGIRRTSIHTNVISNERAAVLMTPQPAQQP